MTNTVQCMIKLEEFYSPQEIRMFRDLGWGYLFNEDTLSNQVKPWALYSMAVEKAFIEKQEGGAVEALRKGTLAFIQCKPYRKTPEFEVLIAYD